MHYSFCKLLYFKCLIMFWIVSVPISGQWFVQWPSAMYCIRHIQNYIIFSTRFFQVYAGILNQIQHYWGTSTHIEILLRNIQACVTIAYSQPCHILSPSIFKIRGLFKTLWNVDQATLEPCHNPVFQNLVQRLHTQKP